MSLSINTNLASLNAQRHQTHSQNDLSTAIARLSSGLRINSAKDDAAGLAIADRFTSQIRGVTQAGRNANDGISLAQTAEGALASIDDNLQRIRELSVQSANATNSASDRGSLQLEVSQLQNEIDRVARQTQFNGINLLDGSFAGQNFQVGANAGETIALSSIPSLRTAALGTHNGISSVGIGPPLGAGVKVQMAIAPNFGTYVPLGILDGDAMAIAAAINAAHIAGFSATANAAVAAAATSTASASASGTASLTVNGAVIALAGLSGTAALGGNRGVAVAAINSRSAATGVVAADTGSGVKLTAADGRNINLAYSAGSFSGSTAADFGLTSVAVTSGSYNYDYVAPAGVTGVAFAFADVPYTTSFAIGVLTGTVGTPVGDIDISTIAGANAGLISVDAALATVTSARASLGAVLNRFSSTIATLQSTGDNLAASRSRTRDADFASETASLSRAQVLQQAGTAMIAQANQTPTQVLGLLRS